ncbi:SUKH-4 family immunity protein [Bacillus sp. DX1.1]|uniref:SUKH-4 family immunity protein n=1 Tax=unclassified Bacillus (in: firmicutes) TaxID=185979 RepID=UPI002570CF9A|nr:MULTISPECIES: SUKH-4 family immunity protein [unclassified Bacillus (in: firmicutes)]MDM5155418.1 SUKH-4 family immunity protein [Bacillus sp. DX1.1]WJE79731.1 SUKH-4 family immunity protein [Bacillus sp. DX3.1]
MISPKEFCDRWNEKKDGPLNKLDGDMLQHTNLSIDTRRFLSEAGLPKSAAPFIEFDNPTELMQNVTRKFGMPIDFEFYWLIGSNGSGDPLCIDERTDKVVYLHHDNNYEEIFINSSIHQFAESLLLFSKLIDEAIHLNGEFAFLENEIPESVRIWFENELKRIDSKALEKNTFWSEEIENLTE